MSIVLLLLTAEITRAAFGNGLSAAEVRGRSIYRKGESPSAKPITASVSGSQIEAKLVPCGSCHGRDGRGRPEGSITPPSIRWEDLTRSRRVADGHERAPYNESLLIRAITMGFDSEGNRLNNAMPRYALSQADTEDLIAYLKAVSHDYDPGVSDEAVRIGALLPPNSRYPGQSAAIQTALTAYFAEVNKAGGLYGRRLELVCRELPAEPGKTAAAYRELLEKEQLFALVASFIAGAEKQTVVLLEEQKIPLVGAWTLLPDMHPSASSPVFYLDSGLIGQSEALAAFALQEYTGTGEKLKFVGSDDKLSQAAIGAARSKLQGSSWATADEMPGPDDKQSANALVERLAVDKVQVLFLALRGSQLLEMLGALKSSGLSPILLIPSALYTEAGGLQHFPGRIFLAVSSLPSDVSPDGSAEYEKLRSEYGLDQRHLAAQFVALSEAKILTEGLKRTGRDLDREHFLQSLEYIHDFSTGFSPEVSFGPTRRTGITQVHIVTVDPATGNLTEVNKARE